MKPNAGKVAISLLVMIAFTIVGVLALTSEAAITVTPRFNWVTDNIRGTNQAHSVGTIAFDSSYPTGGEPLTASAFGFDTRVEALFVSGGCQGYVFQLELVNQTVQVYYGNYDASDGPLIEVPDTTDLSGIDAANYFAIGW